MKGVEGMLGDGDVSKGWAVERKINGACEGLRGR